MEARWIPYLTATGAVLAAIALFFAIRSLIGRARLDALATLPIAPEHRLELPAGELVLHLGGRLGQRGLGDLSFELVDGAGGVVSGTPIVVRSRRSSARWGVLLAVRRFHVATTGTHRLRVRNIPTDRDLADCTVVLARPQDAGLVLGILGVVAAGVLLVLCSVLSLVLWLSPSALAVLQTSGG